MKNYIMDDKFDGWFKEFDENFKKSDAWNRIQKYSQNEKDLLKLYISYKQELWAKGLVIATFVLAVATIILAIT